MPVAGNVFQRAYLNAQNIAAMVEKVSKIPVPEDVVRVEDEDSVRGIDNQIVDKQYELECAIEDKPDYSLPDTYRLQEYDSLTDTEYLAMLRDWDKDRRKDDLDKSKATFFKVIQVIYQIVFWGLSLFMILAAAALFSSEEKSVVGGIIFLITAILINGCFRYYSADFADDRCEVRDSS